MTQKQAIIIEDNLLNTDVLVSMLENQGVQCSSISDPIELPNLLSQMTQVDVVFLDLELPKQSGFELLEQIKLHLKQTPIIACTVHTSEIVAARQVGFDGFLGKPLDARKFPEQLRRIFNGQSVWEL